MIKKVPDRKILQGQLADAFIKLQNVTAKQAAAVRQGNTFRWICSMLKLCGINLSDGQISRLLAEEPVLEATFEDIRLVQAISGLRTQLDRFCDLHTDPDYSLMLAFYQQLSGDFSQHPYRTSWNKIPVIDYIPAKPSMIPGALKELTKDLSARKIEDDPICYGAMLHDRFLSIMPFQDFSVPVAYALMSYVFLCGNLPLPTLELAPEEQLRLSAEFIHTGKSTGLEHLLYINCILECRIPEEENIGEERTDETTDCI